MRAELSEDMYDDGYRNVANVDFSEVVIRGTKVLPRWLARSDCAADAVRGGGGCGCGVVQTWPKDVAIELA
jgi:hypothetical protein